MSSSFSADYRGSNLTLGVLTPRLDAVTAKELREELAMIWRADVGDVIVDLAQVEFVDSSGMGSLLSIHRRLPEKHSPVKLINVRPAVQSVLELVRLHRVFDLA